MNEEIYQMFKDKNISGVKQEDREDKLSYQFNQFSKDVWKYWYEYSKVINEKMFNEKIKELKEEESRLHKVYRFVLSNRCDDEIMEVYTDDFSRGGSVESLVESYLMVVEDKFQILCKYNTEDLVNQYENK